MTASQPNLAAKLSRIWEVFAIFLGLGLTSFGGPVAHLGYFRTAFVARRAWLSEGEYADLVALCQFLPGPASSQVGIAIGHMRAGLAGAIAAWLAFTLPSVVLLYLFALGANLWTSPLAAGLLHGLKIAALAVVAEAVWQMGRRLTPDLPRRVIAGIATLTMLFAPWPALPVLLIAAALFLGAAIARPSNTVALPMARPRPSLIMPLALFAILLVALPLVASLTHNSWAHIADRFYRTGALVFGGGHVVLPLLQNELVTTGLIDRDLFLAGYGAAQAVPGPLFSFAFYAGMLLKNPPNGIGGGLLALAAIYLPAFLLVLGALPLWQTFKTRPRLRAGLDAANAVVVGLLLAALINPIFPSAVTRPLDVSIAIIAFGALTIRVPPLVVVLGCAALGAIL